MALTVEQLAARFSGVKRAGDQYQACCPCHHDEHPSLSIADGEQGLVIYCHAGCETKQILDAVGVSWGELFPLFVRFRDSDFSCEYWHSRRVGRRRRRWPQGA